MFAFEHYGNQVESFPFSLPTSGSGRVSAKFAPKFAEILDRGGVPAEDTIMITIRSMARWLITM